MFSSFYLEKTGFDVKFEAQSIDNFLCTDTCASARDITPQHVIARCISPTEPGDIAARVLVWIFRRGADDVLNDNRDSAPSTFYAL